jgi:hypothetical protein
MTGVALLLVPHLLWRHAYYGALLPNGYYAKTGGGIFQQARGLFYTYNFIEPFGGILLFALPLILLVLRDPTRDEVRAYLASVVVGMMAYIVWVGGDHMPMARFFVPLIAPMMLLLFEAIVELTRALSRSRQMARIVLVAAVVCVTASIAAPTFNQRRLPTSYVIAHRTLTEQWTRAGRWLRANLAPGTVMATEPAGAVAYFSGLPVIDMLGINDAHIAHVDVPAMGRGTAGHEKRDFRYVLGRHPDVIFRGVRVECEQSGRIMKYEDGSSFRLRCEPLGDGPVADSFGVVAQVPLFIWFEERVGPEHARP